jgi:hypothetical protein
MSLVGTKLPLAALRHHGSYEGRTDISHTYHYANPIFPEFPSRSLGAVEALSASARIPIAVTLVSCPLYTRDQVMRTAEARAHCLVLPYVGIPTVR